MERKQRRRERLGRTMDENLKKLVQALHITLRDFSLGRSSWQYHTRTPASHGRARFFILFIYLFLFNNKIIPLKFIVVIGKIIITNCIYLNFINYRKNPCFDYRANL